MKYKHLEIWISKKARSKPNVFLLRMVLFVKSLLPENIFGNTVRMTKLHLHPYSKAKEGFYNKEVVPVWHTIFIFIDKSQPQTTNPQNTSWLNSNFIVIVKVPYHLCITIFSQQSIVVFSSTFFHIAHSSISLNAPFCTNKFTFLTPWPYNSDFNCNFA